jgi:hypothetical protein
LYSGGVARSWAIPLVLASGCGVGVAVSPPVDAEQGRVVLREVLDAWKAGKTCDDLAGQSPPIRVADEDWLAGFRLVSYETAPKDQLIGDVLRCTVSLSLKDKAGKAVKKRVAFNIATAPSPSVIRQD